MKTILAIFLSLTPALILDIHAGSAIWEGAPTTRDWFTASNWTPATVPNGPGDTATFAAANITDIAIREDVEVSSIVFNPGASAFHFRIAGDFGISGPRTLTLSGPGVINNSGVVQNFMNLAPEFYQGQIAFTNSATAGDGNVFINMGNTDGLGGEIDFYDSSTAGTSTIINSGTDEEALSGRTIFTMTLRPTIAL